VAYTGTLRANSQAVPVAYTGKLRADQHSHPGRKSCSDMFPQLVLKTPLALRAHSKPRATFFATPWQEGH